MDYFNQVEKIKGFIKKKYPGYDSEKHDFDVDFAIDLTYDEVVGFCNFEDNEEVPDQLITTMCLMASEYLDSANVFVSAAEIQQGDIKSIKEGDTTVTKITTAEKMAAQTKNMRQQFAIRLVKYRRVKW